MYVTIIVIIIIIYVHYCCYMIYTVERERGALNFSKTTSPSAPGLAIWQPESRLLSLLLGRWLAENALEWYAQAICYTLNLHIIISIIYLISMIISYPFRVNAQFYGLRNADRYLLVVVDTILQWVTWEAMLSVRRKTYLKKRENVHLAKLQEPETLTIFDPFHQISSCI